MSLMSNSKVRVRSAVDALKERVRELIEDAQPEGVEDVFSSIYPDMPPMSVRTARATLFSSVVVLLSADLKKERAQQKKRGIA